jgi:hypothetical protein
MTEIRSITLRAIYDALAMRGLEDGGGGFIRTSAPDQYMDPERLRLAREVIEHLPRTATISGADSLVEQLVPVVLRTMRPGSEG